MLNLSDSSCRSHNNYYYGMKHKSEFKEFEAEVEKESTEKICKLRTDS